VLIAACSRYQAKAGTSEETTASQEAAATGGAAQAAAPEPPAKPVPAQLPDVIARINGEPISKSDVEAQLKGLEGRAGGPVPAAQRDRVVREMLDQLIGYRLLIQETRARNIAVTDAEVEARMGDIRGQFPSEEVFTKALAERNVTLAELRTDTKNDLAITKLLEAEIGAKSAVTPAQIEAFYKENPAQFRQPERVRASHILIRLPEGADAAAKAKVRAQAEQVLADVKKGGDFAALAKQHSADPGSAERGGDLGYFSAGQMVGPFNEAAFSLAPGATSELVETQFGFHIIRVVDKQPAGVVPLDQVRSRVEQFLQGRNRQQNTEAFVNALRAKGKIEILI
jgi:peptidyl-prolyl cis-trans isomerase C